MIAVLHSYGMEWVKAKKVSSSLLGFFLFPLFLFYLLQLGSLHFWVSIMAFDYPTQSLSFFIHIINYIYTLYPPLLAVWVYMRKPIPSSSQHPNPSPYSDRPRIGITNLVFMDLPKWLCRFLTAVWQRSLRLWLCIGTKYWINHIFTTQLTFPTCRCCTHQDIITNLLLFFYSLFFTHGCCTLFFKKKCLISSRNNI